MQETVTVFLTGMSHDGRAAGKIDDMSSLRHGQTVFVENAVAGQKVRAAVTADKKNFLEAVCTEVLEQSPHYAEAICPHHAECGGCSWQHLQYDEQLRQKELFVKNALRRLGNIRESDFAQHCLPVLSCKDLSDTGENPQDNTLRYRNKMEFAFAFCQGRLKLGLRRKNSHDIAEVTECRLMPRQAMLIIEALRQVLRDFDLPFYRYAVVRHFQDTWTLELITYPFSEKNKQAEKQSMERCSDAVRHLVSGLVHGIRKSKTDVAYAEHTANEYGNAQLMQRLCFAGHDTLYKLGSRAFFQVNTAMAQLLYGVVQDFAKCVLPEKNSHVWDFYCGVGSIGLSLAPFCEHNDKQPVFSRYSALVTEYSGFLYKKPLLIGAEAVESAILLAEENARLNNCGFARFECCAGKDIGKFFKRFSLPHLLILDPPRAGIEAEALAAILRFLPPYLILVSCNASTLARDLGKLVSAYRILAVQPVDLFPHTPHVETVVLLSKAGL